MGSFVELKARLLPPLAPSRPGSYDFSRDMFFQGIGASGFVMGAIKAAEPPESGGLRLRYAAFMQGLRDAIDARKIRRHYINAPIAEALIDIQTDNAQLGSLAEIEELTNGLTQEFPTRLPLHQLQMGFQVPPGGNPEFMKEQQIIGYRLDRPGRVLQFRINGFSYSHPAPYSDWPTFSAEARRFWEMYTSAIKPLLANRTAGRVINLANRNGFVVKPNSGN